MHRSVRGIAAPLTLAATVAFAPANAQQPPTLYSGTGLLAQTAQPPAARELPPDSVLVRGMAFRNIGPALMGGRIADIAVAQNPPSVRGGMVGTVIYIAAATGGIWKSTNAGTSWTSISDSIRSPSYGAIAVAPSNSEIVWVGSGEPNNMRSSSWGNGVYKSTD